MLAVDASNVAAFICKDILASPHVLLGHGRAYAELNSSLVCLANCERRRRVSVPRLCVEKFGLHLGRDRVLPVHSADDGRPCP